MAFKFKLEIVLTHVLRQEEELRQKLAKANREYEMATEALEQLYASVRQTQTDLDSSKISIPVRLLSYAYLEKLDIDIEHQNKIVSMTLMKLKNAKEKVIEITKKKKILEKLKEKREQEYLKELSLVEQKALDEMALNAFQRN